MNKIIAIIILSLLAIFLLVFLVFPKHQDIRVFQAEIRRLKANSEHLQAYALDLQKINKNLEKYNQVLSKIDSALPSELFLPDVISHLQKTSAGNGLIFKDFSSLVSQPLKEGSDIKKHSLGLTVVGSYPAFKNFLSALEKSARLFTIENISFSTPGEEELFSFSLTLKFHSY